MNNLNGLIPVLYAALQVVSRELIGIVPATSRNMTAASAALNQIVRVPITPASANSDITPGTPPTSTGTNFSFVDMAITKNRIAKPIVWNGDEQISIGSQLNQLLVNQYAQSMRSLINEAEADLCFEAFKGAVNAGNVYGTPGVTPFAANLGDLAQIKKIQDDNGTPIGDRHLIINTATGASLRTLEKLSNVNQAGETDLLRRGELSNLMGYAVRESAGFVPTVPGTATAITTAGVTAVGSTNIGVTALSGTLNVGAIINIGGTYYGVTAPAGSGDTTISIAPAVKSQIATATAGTVLASSLPNVAFSRDFLYFLTRTPAMPQEGDNAKDVVNISDPVSGLTFQAALYGDYRQVRIEIGLAWGFRAVNNTHGVVLLG
jgi:hypothetical protein